VKRFSKISCASATKVLPTKAKELRFCTRASYHGARRFSKKASQLMSVKLRIVSAMKQIVGERQVSPPLDSDHGL
jgi:hypothetical protein